MRLREREERFGKHAKIWLQSPFSKALQVKISGLGSGGEGHKQEGKTYNSVITFIILPPYKSLRVKEVLT